MGLSDWAGTRPHTFATGRTAELRMFPNLLAMLDQDVDLESGAVPPGAMRKIVRLLMVRPRLLEPGEAPGEDDKPGDTVRWEDFGEAQEVLILWREAVDAADRFRQERAGPLVGANGEILGDEPQPDAGPPARKHPGRPRGSGARGPARGA